MSPNNDNTLRNPLSSGPPDIGRLTRELEHRQADLEWVQADVELLRRKLERARRDAASERASRLADAASRPRTPRAPELPADAPADAPELLVTLECVDHGDDPAWDECGMCWSPGWRWKGGVCPNCGTSGHLHFAGFLKDDPREWLGHASVTSEPGEYRYVWSNRVQCPYGSRRSYLLVEADPEHTDRLVAEGRRTGGVMDDSQGEAV